MHIERGAWAEINLDAIAHNVQVAKANLKPSTKLCAVVKADAYGHGAVRVAIEAARNGADFLAVALLQEAVKLRERVKAIDPHAFIIITTSSEIIGKGFRSV